MPRPREHRTGEILAGESHHPDAGDGSDAVTYLGIALKVVGLEPDAATHAGIAFVESLLPAIDAHENVERVTVPWEAGHAFLVNLRTTAEVHGIAEETAREVLAFAALLSEHAPAEIDPLYRHDQMIREHKAWLAVVEELRAAGAGEINAGQAHESLHSAVVRWGEELAELRRVGDRDVAERALEEKRSNYPLKALGEEGGS